MDNKQETYKLLEVADVATAQATVNSWAKQGWILDKISFCQKSTSMQGNQVSFTNWYLLVLSKKV